MRRHELTNDQWEQIKPHLPEPAETGRPPPPARQVINGILWILRTGAPWRDLPERYGPWQTIYGRFNQWCQEGVWDRLFRAIQRSQDGEGQLDWTIHYVDGSIVRAHQHAAGGPKKGDPLT